MNWQVVTRIAEVVAIASTIGIAFYWSGTVDERLKVANLDSLIAEKDKAIAEVRAAVPAHPGRLIQIQHDQTNEYISTDKTIPYDRKKPTNDQGVEVLKVSITPKTTKGYLLIEGVVYAAERENKGDILIVALFRNDEKHAFASALNHFGIYEYVAAGMRPILIRHVVPNTGQLQEFTLRVGMNVGLVDINGAQGKTQLGKTVYSSLTVFEIAHE